MPQITPALSALRMVTDPNLDFEFLRSNSKGQLWLQQPALHGAQGAPFHGLIRPAFLAPNGAEPRCSPPIPH
jgi:hypothetical protein